MTSKTEDDNEELSSFRVESRRQIVSILRSVSQRNQLVRMEIKKTGDSAVTSILDVDETDGIVIIDCASSATTNQRFLDSDMVSFETMLDSIRILFSASRVTACQHDGRPALSIAIPEYVIRLQRREYYRVSTPVANPVRCTLQVKDENGDIVSSVALPLFNISAGGIGIVDEKKVIDLEDGTYYDNCRIDFPGGMVTVKLRLTNTREISLGGGKSIRRHGMMFIDPGNATLAAIQRYITKAERDQNARATGLG